MTEKLAILGGRPVIRETRLIARDRFTEADRSAAEEYFKSGEPLSFYGDEGLQHTYEHALQDYFSARHCVLVNSGTNALLAAYFALGLMPGDEVIVPAFSFFAVASPLVMLHVLPVMADCSPDTGLIEPEDVFGKVTERTKAVVINHLCGDSIQMQPFADELRKRKIALVEDLSLAFGASDNGKKLGRFGDLACCSLGSTKLLSGGQGGFVITDNREYYERIILLGCFGKRARQNVLNPFYRQFSNVSYGLNIRMHALAIAVSYSRFLRSEEMIRERHKRYHMLSDCIREFNFISPPREMAEKKRGSWHGYYAVWGNDDGIPACAKIADALRAEGLFVHCGAHYPLLHKEKLYRIQKDGFFRTKKNPYKGNEEEAVCPGADYYNEHILSFPLFLDEDISIVQNYCDAVYKVFSQIDKLKGE